MLQIFKIICSLSLLVLTLLDLSGCASGKDVSVSSAPSPVTDEINALYLQRLNDNPNPESPPSKTKDSQAKTDPRNSFSKSQSNSQSEELSPIRTQAINADKVMQVELAANLWTRIRMGFSMPDLESELVSDRQSWYVSKSEYLLRMTQRSEKYLYYIVEELERRHMPTELALLPFIQMAWYY